MGSFETLNLDIQTGRKHGLKGLKMAGTNIKIAYLIIAHNHPEHLSKMIEQLDNDSVEFFIHIDKRSPIEPFLKALAGRKRITFVKKTYKIYWKGFTQIRAAMSLLESSLACRANYYILLSGVDYPLKPNKAILDFFDNNKTEYIHYFSLYDLPKWPGKIKHFFFWDSIFTNPRQGFKRTRSRYLKHIHNKFILKLPERRYFKDIHPYGGSQWWMLTYGCAKYCFDFLTENTKFRNFYRFTDSPDEMVFQTIVLNSRFAVNTINYESYQKQHDEVLENIIKKPLGFTKFNLRYIDWHSPQRGFPATLDESNFDEMKASGAMFARKFDTILSKNLLDKIDNELLAD